MLTVRARNRWIRYLGIIIIFPGLLGVYLKTLAPTVTAEDSGELIAAAATLGVAHPPGYVSWVILGKFFSYLPIASVAYRLNVMSAFFGVATLVLLYFLLFFLSRDHLLALGTAIIVGLTDTFWSQSIIAEVYTLNSFFTMLTVYFLILWKRSGEMRFLYAFSLVYGLSITNHYMMLIFGPVYFYFVISNQSQLIYQPRRVLILSFSFFLGISLLFSMLLLARRHPPLCWGCPDNLQSLLDVIRRVQYRSLEFGESIAPTTKLQFLLYSLSLLYRQFPLHLFLLGVVGLLHLRKKHPDYLTLSALVFIANLFILTFLLQFEYTELNQHRVMVYYLPAYLMYGSWICLGLMGLLEWLRHILLARSSEHALLVAKWTILLFSVILLLGLNFKKNDMSDYYYASDYAHDIMDTLEPDAIVFPLGDHQTFPLAYYHIVEGKRPDIIIGDLYGYPTEEVLQLFADTIGKDPSIFSRKDIENAVIENANRPVYFFERRDMSKIPEYELIPHGIMYKAVKKEPKSTLDKEIWHGYRIPRRSQHIPEPDMMAKSVLFSYPFFQAEYALREGKIDEALDFFDEALAIEDGSYDLQNNVANVLAENGYSKEAKRHYFEALAKSPSYFVARMNLGNLYCEEEDFRRAARQYAKALEIKPDNEDARTKLENALGSIIPSDSD
jgi:tetratricopeptide (TPR) repeat protein